MAGQQSTVFIRIDSGFFGSHAFAKNEQSNRIILISPSAGEIVYSFMASIHKEA